jgi:sec-independent protein translocase protein TatA
MTLGFLLFLGLGTTEILLIALVVLLFFGGRKIPELMKGLGKGVKSFKDGMEGMEEEMKKPSEKAAQAEQTEKKA